MSAKPKLLLVDDLSDNLVALDALLRRPDVEILAAASGRQALELLLANEVALALIDVHMPGMDGFDLAELMRGTARTRDVPIIFVTAGPHDHHRQFKGYDSGAVDFLYKPLDEHALRNKVEVFLQLYRHKQLLSERLGELELAQEQLREAARRKDEFLGLLSHELRNPLTPIRNSLYILQRSKPGAEQARRAEAVIDRQVSYLARLVDDLLDVTRISRGKVQLRREARDLSELVRRTLDDHQAAFTAAGITLKAEISPEPLRIRGDATRIAQAIGNVLCNAVKFTERQGTVEVTLRREPTGAVLQVRDSGVGIAPEILRRIFDPFAQADRTLDRSRGGLGLGLALVKGMIELHGGTVAAASDGPGQGALFTICLPLEEDLDLALEPSKPSRRCSLTGRRVLIIEDNLDCGDSLREVLELMGHEVRVARDGPEGLATARVFGPEIVLCDIGLPEMNGYEVARRLRLDEKEARALLVAVTGYALAADQQRALDSGFDRHLAKPPSIEALQKLMETAPPRG